MRYMVLSNPDNVEEKLTKELSGACSGVAVVGEKSN